jgi:hypothetical protein
MKGVQYLTDENGNKTHVVLDLKVWQAKWQDLLQEPTPQTRRFGNLKHMFEKAGFTKNIGDALLEPMTQEELSDWYDSPIFPDEPSS